MAQDDCYNWDQLVELAVIVHQGRALSVRTRDILDMHLIECEVCNEAYEQLRAYLKIATEEAERREYENSQTMDAVPAVSWDQDELMSTAEFTPIADGDMDGWFKDS